MQKIPTVFKRNPDDMRKLLPEVHPDCQWVLDGEGIGTRKYDGTCCMFDGEKWWARREVKPGKRRPPNFVEISTDPNTEKIMGWEPMGDSGFAKWHKEARALYLTNGRPQPGTYELCGPKINGNPEGFSEHILIPHALAEIVLHPGLPMSFVALRDFVLLLADTKGAEGVVWHHPDGRMAKLKARDFKFDY